jgi:hypothetical protein
VQAGELVGTRRAAAAPRRERPSGGRHGGPARARTDAAPPSRRFIQGQTGLIPRRDALAFAVQLGLERTHVSARATPRRT